MIVEAYKSGDKYVLPLVGKDEKIEIIIDEDKYQIDWTEYVKHHSGYSKKLTKDEYEYRKHLMLDQVTMEENWEKLVTTHENPYIDDDDRIEEAHANWNKE